MGVLLYHRNGETFRTLYPDRRGKTAESNNMKNSFEKVRLTQKEFIDTLKSCFKVDSVSQLANRLSSVCYMASEHYKENGYEFFEKEVGDVANALYTILDNKGYYDDIKEGRC